MINKINQISETPEFQKVLSCKNSIFCPSANFDNSYSVLLVNEAEAIILFDEKEYDKNLLIIDSIKSELKNLKITKITEIPAEHSVIDQINTRSIESIQASLENETSQENYMREVIQNAIDLDASDIHIEVNDKDSVLQYRIWGHLTNISRPSKNKGDALDRILYTKASPDSKDPNRNVAVPQDAMIQLETLNPPCKLRYNRVPIFPNGYRVVMRIIPLKPMTKTIDSMGYSDKQVVLLKEAIGNPLGLMVFAGKVNSGKSTTVTALLQETINKSRDLNEIINVLMVENPPEYIVDGVTKIPVIDKDGKGNGWSLAMRAMLRQDADALGIGEIRDKASAELLTEAVLSGHPVITTLHANSPLEIVTRLYKLDVDPDIMSSESFWRALAFQGLTPLLCNHCKIKLSENEKNTNQLSDDISGRIKKILKNYEIGEFGNIYVKGNGCEHCNHGISGREVCASIIVPDHDIVKHFEKMDIVEAQDEWNSRKAKVINPDKNIDGLTVFDHAVHKMFQGKISPLDVERYFGRI